MINDAMTVEELRDVLAGYDNDLPVYFAQPAGNVNATTPIQDCSSNKVNFSEEHDMCVVSALGFVAIILE